MCLSLPSSRWWCLNGGYNMVSMMPLWGVNDKMSLQRYGGSLLSCNASSLIVGEWPPLRLVVTKKDEDRCYSCPLSPLLYGRRYN